MKIVKQIHFFSKKRIAIVIFLLFLLLVTVTYQMVKPRENITTIKIAVTKLRGDVNENMRKIGREAAYKKIIEQYKDEDYRYQHQVLHIFGEELYRKFGMSAVFTCDSTFSYACFHGFFIEAVADKGLAVLPELDKACTTNPKFDIECHHGIGHGIMSQFGKGRVIEASAICSRLSTYPAVVSCRDGVFMEYHFETNLNADDSIRYTVQRIGDDPFDPCPKLPAEDQVACYGNLPEWWFSFGKEVMSANEGMKLCVTLESRINKISCLLNLGYYIPPVMNYDVQKSIEACESMTDIEAKIICKTSAHQSFKRKGFIKEANMICKETGGLPESCANRNQYLKEIGLNYE